MDNPKYPGIRIRLTSIDGNAFSIIGTCIKEMKKAKLSAEEQKAFGDEAMSDDYDHLLKTVMKWFKTS